MRRTKGGQSSAAAHGIGKRTPRPRRERFLCRWAGAIALCAGLMAAPGVGAQTTPPAVSSGTPPSIIQDAGAPASFKLGDQVTVEVTFTRAVTVTGSPRIGLDIGGVRRDATYRSGDGTVALLFDYTTTWSICRLFKDLTVFPVSRYCFRDPLVVSDPSLIRFGLASWPTRGPVIMTVDKRRSRRRHRRAHVPDLLSRRTVPFRSRLPRRSRILGARAAPLRSDSHSFRQ